MTTTMDGTDVRGHRSNKCRCGKEEGRQNTGYSGLFSRCNCFRFDFFRSFRSLRLSVGDCLFCFFHFRLGFRTQRLNALDSLIHSSLGVILTKPCPSGDLTSEPSAVRVRDFTGTKQVSQNTTYLTLEIRQVLSFLTGYRASLTVCAQ